MAKVTLTQLFFYTNMVCVQFTAENGAHVEGGLQH